MKAINEKAERFDRAADYTAPNIRTQLLRLSGDIKARAYEIRLKTGAPVMISLDSGCMPIGAYLPPSAPYTVTKEDMAATFEFITGASVHSVLEELRCGFITIRGGHRVGVCGKVITDGGGVLSIRDVSSLNFRIAREIKGCADAVIDEIIKDNRVRSVIVISPPSCGKTTLLRDIARQLSNGVETLGFKGVKVGVIDERSEICAMYKGEPQNDVGVRTDVLDMCPKSIGVSIMLRSMSPDVIITDELLNEADARAVMTAHNTGVAVIASAHGESVDEIRKKPAFSRLFDEKVFSLAVTLSNVPRLGTPSVHYL
ncbi:MAG: stage III sporulation protein AA [Clostridia bacterium]|nr:stage III sporulation protein AA [Clostridia bacterium]